MTTQLAFTFGMLAVISIGMIIGVIVGLVKVYRLEAKQKETTRDMYQSIDRAWQRMNEIEVALNNQITQTERNIGDELNDIRRNIDSRFDKFENKIMTKVEPDMTGIDLVIEKTKGKKQLLKD
jgi:hypothetical protein